MAATEIEDQRKDDDDLEKGEIIDDNSNAEKPSKSIATTHPLENAWTFWFDNHTAKSKQADFIHGVNFVVASATEIPAEFLADKNIVNSVTNSSYSVELDWMWSHFNSICYSDQDCAEKLMNSLFVVGEIGSNDYYYALPQGKTMKDVNGMVFDVVQAIIEGIRNLIAGNVNGTSDPYALVTCDTEKRLSLASEAEVLQLINLYHGNEITLRPKQVFDTILLPYEDLQVQLVRNLLDGVKDLVYRKN
uniref:Uncharacterized protein n=1 Tax=Chenopodium quinoa TaxID=63459 RepID=A0A803N3X5_CHEQI